MNKKELEKLINKTGIIDDTCAHLLTCVKCGKCTFDESIETCADYQLVMTIEKELEVLKMLKNYIDYYICRDTDGNSCINIVIPESVKNYTIIKEWLDND